MAASGTIYCSWCKALRYPVAETVVDVTPQKRSKRARLVAVTLNGTLTCNHRAKWVASPRSPMGQ